MDQQQALLVNAHQSQKQNGDQSNGSYSGLIQEQIDALAIGTQPGQAGLNPN